MLCVEAIESLWKEECLQGDGEGGRLREAGVRGEQALATMTYHT